MFYWYLYLLTCLVCKFKTICVGVSQNEWKSRNRTSIWYSPMYVHQFTSNSKVRCKCRQVIYQSLNDTPSKSNCNSITTRVSHMVIAMSKLMNQFSLICNTIQFWQLNYLLGCLWLTELGGGTVIVRQSCAKSTWHTQVLFSWYGCNEIIKLRIIGIHLYILLAPTL